MDAPQVEAAGTLATAVIAGVGLIYASRQTRHARLTREEVTRPYVVAYMEMSPLADQFYDLVIKNFGQTAAYDVRLIATPAIVRSSGSAEPEVVRLFDTLPTLAPLQEFRTFYDRGWMRKGLPVSHQVEVSYGRVPGAPEKERLHTDCALSWAIYEGNRALSPTRLKEVVKALEAIATAISTDRKGR